GPVGDVPAGGRVAGLEPRRRGGGGHGRGGRPAPDGLAARGGQPPVGLPPPPPPPPGPRRAGRPRRRPLAGRPPRRPRTPPRPRRLPAPRRRPEPHAPERLAARLTAGRACWDRVFRGSGSRVGRIVPIVGIWDSSRSRVEVLVVSRRRVFCGARYCVPSLVSP